MSLPPLVLIDDSDAILAFEHAVLSPHYAVTTATDGATGLALVRQLHPAGVLLDLSMPGMPGEEVLHEIRADPALHDIPVMIVSSEKARGEACLAAGAAAFLAKPIRADDLVAMVGRVLDATRTKLARAGLAILAVGAGPLEVGIPLELVHLVTLQTDTQPLPAGPSYLAELFELRGEAVCVLDLPLRLGVEHSEPLLERKLVVVEQDGFKIGVCVDRVRDPEEIAAADITPITEAMHADGVRAVVRTARGQLPVIVPHALLSRGLLQDVQRLIAELGRAES